MPLKLIIKKRQLGTFLNLRRITSYSREKLHEIISEDIIVNDLALVNLHFTDKLEGSLRPLQCKILARNMSGHNTSNIKIKVCCQDTAEAFYSEWICNNEWKEIGKRRLCDLLLDDVYTCVMDINISASKAEESFLVKLYNDIDFTDFSLTTDEGSVAVHRAHLAAHSDVSRAMLSREWKEKTEGQVQIQGVTLKTLQHLKEYMYLRSLPDEGLEPLLLLAQYYLIDDLKKECVSKLILKCKSGEWRKLLDFAIDNRISELICGLMLVNPDRSAVDVM